MSSGRFIPQPVGNPNDVTTINDNFNNVADAFNNTLSRQNDLPNAMNTTLDMNGYSIINQANPVVLTSFNWRGNWQTGQSYSEGDAVFYNSTSYLCGIANTANASFMVDLLAERWSKIDLGTIYKGTWAISTPYFIGDTIVNANQFYVCITDHISGLSFNPSFWQAYGAFGSMASQNSTAISVTGGTMSGVTVPDPTLSTQIANKEYVDTAAAAAGVTGDIKLTYNTAQPASWIQMADGSIGSAASGATYANANALALFTLWWGYSAIWFPFTDGSSRGVSAAADFAANKAMMLPYTVGRAFLNCGNAAAALNKTFTGSSSTSLLTVNETGSLYTGTPVTVANSGGALPAPLAAATTYYVINVSGTTVYLATTRANANLGTNITLTNNGSGTNTLTVNYQALVVGQILGESAHQSLGTETGAHIHGQNAAATFSATANGGDHDSQNQGSSNTDPNTGDQPHNNMQPSTSCYVYVRL